MGQLLLHRDMDCVNRYAVPEIAALDRILKNWVPGSIAWMILVFFF